MWLDRLQNRAVQYMDSAGNLQETDRTWNPNIIVIALKASCRSQEDPSNMQPKRTTMYDEILAEKHRELEKLPSLSRCFEASRRFDDPLCKHMFEVNLYILQSISFDFVLVSFHCASISLYLISIAFYFV